MFSTYILQMANAKYYVGSTADLQQRLKEHQEGGSWHTKGHLPVKLVYSEPHTTRESAAQREYQIKRWSQAKKEALIAGNIELLKSLSKSK